MRGFKPTRRDLAEFLSLLDYTVMTTSRHGYICHCLELWSDTQKINLPIDIFSEGEETWVLMAMTRPEAKQFTIVATAGQYLSTHEPEAGPEGEGGTVHALMRSQRGPVQCFVVRNQVMSSPTAHTVFRVRARRDQR